MAGLLTNTFKKAERRGEVVKLAWPDRNEAPSGLVLDVFDGENADGHEKRKRYGCHPRQ